MSSNIIASIQPAKENPYVVNGAIIYGKAKQQKKREDEEKNFLEITRGDQGIYQILHEGKEAIIMLTMHKDEDEEGLNFPSKLTVSLPQLSLPTFSGDPKQWRQFWSSFDAAVHSQAIPDIQKLNYLYSCFKGNALQVVSGYDIVPENYGVIRRLLKEKYGKSSMITTILYKKLQSIIKGNERDWKKVIENIERVLRQLEALGEEMEHSSIENLIEGKLPRWILNKLYEQKKAERTWSTSKLRELLLEVANMDEQVSKVLNLSTQAESKPTTTKFGQKQRYNPEETSALSTIRSNPKVPQPATNKKRLYIF
uniref:Gag protein n=1 Tax=Wuchereria bancrofti TaxID=6293 RepID=A0AAF5PFZ8_WUCBA